MSIVMVNAKLWDGSGTAPQRNAALHIDGETVVWTGPTASAPPASAVDIVVDAAGRWLMPGLIDLHVHFTFDPQQADTFRYCATTPVPEQALLGARNARQLLEAGFTGARDMGGLGYANVALKRAIDAGWIPGPRVVTAGWFLTVPGGHMHWLLPPDHHVASPHVVSGPTEVRRAVREQVRRGADWIKALVTGGVLTGGTSLSAALWEDEEIQAAVSMARRLGRSVAAHCHGGDGMIAAANAGVATIEHGTMGDQRAAEAMQRNGTVLVPTFCAAAAVVREAKAGRLPPAVSAQALAMGTQHAASFRAARDAGVRVGFGTDTGVPGAPFGQNAHEFEHLLAHGLSAEEALLAATRDAAQLLGWGGRIGTLQPGYVADFLLVDGDPLQNPGQLAEAARLHAVGKGGEIVVDRRPERATWSNLG